MHHRGVGVGLEHHRVQLALRNAAPPPARGAGPHLRHNAPPAFNHLLPRRFSIPTPFMTSQ